MTVKELMDILAKLDPEMVVSLYNGGYGSYDAISRVEVEEMEMNDEVVIY